MSRLHYFSLKILSCEEEGLDTEVFSIHYSPDWNLFLLRALLSANYNSKTILKSSGEINNQRKK